MKRRIVRAVLISVVVIGVPAVFLRSGGRVALDDLIEVGRLSSRALPGLLQRIRSFHRVVTRDGKKLLEVSAKEARYYSDETTIEIIEPKIVFFDDGQPVGEISGASGRAALDGNDITSIVMRGGVRFRLAQFTLETDELSYDRTRDRIAASGPSSVTSPELTLRGSDITVDLRARTLRVEANVEMSLRKLEDANS